MDNFWPEDIGITAVNSPVAILKRQATALGERTQNIVEGKVDRFINDRDRNLSYSFYIVAPCLGNYRWKMLTICHMNHELYPLRIELEQDIYNALPDGLRARTAADFQQARCEDEFIEYLRAILATDKVKGVVQAIIAQSA